MFAQIVDAVTRGQRGDVQQDDRRPVFSGNGADNGRDPSPRLSSSQWLVLPNRPRIYHVASLADDCFKCASSLKLSA